jgi:hypothetical protein
MERRDQQQQRQKQGMAALSIMQNWQQAVDMSLLRSIGSSIVKPIEEVETGLSGSFGSRLPFQFRKARTSREEACPIGVMDVPEKSPELRELSCCRADRSIERVLRVQ